MSNKNLTIGLLITLVIAVLGVFTPIVQEAKQTFGNVINGNWTAYSGVWFQSSSNQTRYGSDVSTGAGTNIESIQRIAMTSGTTTVCAILSPAATSTLLNYSILPTIGTTTQSTLIIGTSTTGFLPIGQIFGGVGYAPMGSYTITGATTTVDAINIPPSTYVVTYMNATTATGGFVMTGFCTADFLTQ